MCIAHHCFQFPVSNQILFSNRYIQPRGLSPVQQMQPRLSEYLPPPMHIVTPSIEPAPHYDDPTRYDDAPPGTQPPPPGEQSPVEQFSRDREKWNPELDRHRRTPDKGAPSTFDERRHTPDLRDRLNAEASGRTHRSTSRSAVEHHRSDRIERDKRRHSKTPTHRDGRKDVESSRDRGRDDKHDKSSSSRKESERDRSTVKDRHRGSDKTDDRDVKRDKEKEREREREKEKERERKEKEKEKDKEKEKRKESSDEEKRDRKTKEKKKKKKEEKALEKKKKKERKEKEKREKELRKEQDRARKLLESNVDRKSVDNDEQSNRMVELPDTKEQNDSNEQSESLSKELYDDVPNTPEKQMQTSENVHSTKMDDFDIDEGDDADADVSKSDIRSSAPATKETNRSDEHSMDLYGDIIGDELDMSYPDADGNLRPTNESSPTHQAALNRSDSILDIHANLDFEHEMDEIEPDVKKSSQGFLPFPELSKWEREDEMYLYGDKKSGSDASPYDEKNAGKVTNEVIKRAENAIFTRAINAIRPIEIKKISTDRQKLYANEKRENSPDAVGIADDIQTNMKITVPVFTNEERSVELKSDIRVERDRTKTPVRSIKDRLGSKVHNSPRSRTRTPPRKLIVDNGHNDKDRSRDRNKRDDRPRDGDKSRSMSSRTNETRRGHDTKRGGVTKVEKDDRTSSRDHSRDDKHDKSNRKTDRDRSTKDTKDRHRLEKTDDRDNRQRERDRQVETDREKDREKEKERARQMARAREMERIKEMNRKQLDKEKADKRDGKRDRSESVDLKHRREQGKDEKKPKLDLERTSSKHVTERKRTSIDESKFVPDYDESDKKSESTRRKPVDGKQKEQEKRKSRSNSESSSSSDSDSSDSSSDSEDKKRKKRKHKKQKRSKRASSASSDASSSKKKKSKHKKSKKKKKAKTK